MIDEKRLIEDLRGQFSLNDIDPDMCFIRIGEVRNMIMAQVQEQQSASAIKIRSITEWEATWQDLSVAADNGNLSTLLHSGDYIPLTLKNGDEVGLEVGRDESGRTYFIFRNTMKDRYHMNPDWTRKGGWRDSKMRRYANKEVFNLFPEEVKAIIKPTTIVQVLDGEHIETDDKLFCLSSTQVFGKSENWSEQEPEDTQIDIFRDPLTRCKVWLGADNRRALWWWLRSAAGSDYFRGVTADGSNSTSHATAFGAVALGFCIENP